MMRPKRQLPLFVVIIGVLLIGMVAGLVVYFHVSRPHSAKKAIIAGAQDSNPAPFLHRPYYGTQTILQRTVSFVDHDKPWYEDDGVFVRYDGQRWTGSTIMNCSPGVNCYDGHNGYDLNLHFEPVLSAAAGTVIRAGWYNPLDHDDAFGLWVAIDHGNGFVTAYGHLSAITVADGDYVGTQWQIGTSGTTGSSTGPHLHMSTYYLPDWQATDPFGWTGNYPDPNIVPDNYLWVNDPGTATTIPNLSGSAIYSGAIMVDDGSAGWSSTGTWFSSNASSDVNGDMHWTPTSSGSTTASATWTPALPADGYYEVGFYVDDNHASSSWVPCTIYSADPNHDGVELQHTVYLDESHIGLFQGPYGTVNTGPQWVGLGTYYFRKAMNGRVAINNATGESGAQLGADGVEFVPVNVQASLPAPTPSPTSSAANDGFSVTSNTTPSTLAPGATLHVNLGVKNTSGVSWPSTGSTAVALGYHWLDSSGHALNPAVAGISSTAPLPSAVAPGGSANIALTLHTPALAGTYRLVYDMQRGETWFSSQGATPATMTVTIAPTLAKTYYFAEGYTGPGTTENLSLTNLAPVAANVTITYLYQRGAPLTHTYQVAAQSHRVLNINQEAGANQSVSMIVQGDQPFVAERTMFTHKGAFVASTDSVGSTILSTNWYFAEGNTTFGWNTLLSVMNPSALPSRLTVTALNRSSGLAPQTHVYTLPARARSTIVLNLAVPRQQFGLAVNASSGVVVERDEYLVVSPWHGGSSVVGAVAPQKTWYLGAGDADPGFTERLVLANPAAQPATAQIRYLTTSGRSITQNVTVPGMSRVEVNVNRAVGQTLHATIINASAPIVAERQDFFNMNLSGATLGSTTSIGSNSAHTSWYLAQGDTSAGHLEELALANPNTTSAQVELVYFQASGAPIIKTLTIAADTRVTLNIADAVGVNQSSGIAIYATLPIVAEQRMFFHLPGATGGYAAMAYGTN